MKKHIILFIFLLLSGIIFSQKKDKEELDTQEITVVKPFTPTVSDAYKIKIGPKIDSIELAKKDIEYSINSIPVASTFTPAKGKAKTIKRAPKEYIYNNYISAGYGNYSTPIVEAFIHGNNSSYNDFGGFLDFHSSGGRIKNVKLDDNFLDLNIDLFFKQTERNFKWQTDGGFNHLANNWYGLTPEINFSNNVIESIDEKQAYTEFYLGGEIEFFNAILHKGKSKFSSFSDKHKSKEINGFISGLFDFPIGQEMLSAELSFDFLGGLFEQSYTSTNNIEYTFFNIGLSPNFEVLRDNLTINIGGRFYYSLTNAENQKSKFFIYPNVTASYKVVNETLIAYVGVTGDLEQNSYKNFVNENPFVSPTLNMKRTSQQYNGYVGIKGLLNSNINFDAKIAYGNEIDKPLFKLNPAKTNGSIEVQKGYEAGNSFQVIYDDVSTIHASAEVIFDFDQNIKFGGNIEFNSYNLDAENYAWNLPKLKSTLIARYTTPKWSAGADFFFASERKDELKVLLASSELITNSSYFDINVQGFYNLNDRISVFINLNNLLNINYQEYTNFRVQGFQVFGGLKYKFDL
ncbi:MAG: TonB-dependent receptor [Flavobacteriaceae bacterium]|nr:TonB-dependent receptor [Flavobacteriaceae bacterium]